MNEEWKIYEFEGNTNFFVSNLGEDVEFFINIINRYLRQYGNKYELISVHEIVYHDTDYKDYDFFSNLNYTLFLQEDSGIKEFSIDRL